MSGGGKKGGGVPDIPTEKSSLKNPITFYKARTGAYPSNAQIWWAYKRPLEIGTDSPPKNYLEVFDPSLRHQISLGNTPAPKGHYILNAFHQDRSAASGVEGLPVVSSGGNRPSAVAFYAGRVFYAGVNVSGFNTKIYFTQILERATQVQECYQAQDPTSEDIRDLLPSDGGVIVIPEVSEVYHLQTMGQALYVFARNGVWQISGSEGIGFAANDYSVSKVSGVPAISNLSFVTVEGAPLWWNRSGIYTLAANQLGGATVQSLTDETIKTFFEEIPSNSKFYAKGSYDPVLGQVQWLYRSIDASSDAELFKYDKILVLDVKSGAFYPYSPVTGPVEMVGLFDAEGMVVDVQNVQVMHEEDTVLVDDLTVSAKVEMRYQAETVLKYIINILDSSDFVPEPPPAPESLSYDVYVSDSPVFAGTSQAIITEIF